MLNRSAYKGDSEIREQWIEKNMPLVGFVTARFMGRGYDYDDLYQYGCIGLIKAVDRFDPEYGVAFSTYAVPLIIGEIKRFIRGDGSVHVSRTIRENAYKVMHVMEENDKDGNNLSLEDICSRTGIDKQEAVIAMNALAPVKSIYEPVAADGEILLQDMLGSADSGQNVTDKIAISQAMVALDENERNLIVRRYFQHHTQTAVANDLGMTQVQVSRMEKKVLAKLREMLT